MNTLASKFAVLAAVVAVSAQAQNACSLLSSRYISQNKSATATYKPSEVFACLQEVPINKTSAVAFVDWMLPFMEQQSTLAYLKNPPSGYPFPPTDLLGGLDSIKSNVSLDKYGSEYEFELDIHDLIVSARDGHLAVGLPLLSQFLINRNVQLVSVSLDGVQVPKVYVLTDLQGLAAGNTSQSPSAISSIDGVDVDEQLFSTAYDVLFQDRDAIYNDRFASPVVVAENLTPVTGTYAMPFSFTSHNDSTIYGFENGSTKIIQNSVTVPPQLPLLFSSGQDLYNKYLLPSSTSMPAKESGNPNGNSGSPPPTAPSVVPGDPLPVPGAQTPNNWVSGYFPDGESSRDVAVLVISSFHPLLATEQLDFQQAVKTFLDACRATRKQRLIIDVRQNPGGQFTLLMDVFKQLFPNETPYSGTRIRATNINNVIGEQISSISSSAASLNQVRQLLAAGGTNLVTVPNFAQGYLKTPDSVPFSSWNDFYGPNQFNGDNFSNVGAFRLSPSFYTYPLTISGYGNQSASSQPFASENIVLLTDSDCSSSCALFANLVINQGNVTTVTAGGRPNLDPIAVIGGTQGGEELNFQFLQSLATQAMQTAASSSDEQTIAFVNKTLAPVNKSAPIVITSFQFNNRDNIAKGDVSQMPLQFTKSPMADCRMFYMPGDMANVSYTWKRVAEGIKVGGKGLCVNGTIRGHSGSAYGAPAVASVGTDPSISGAMYFIHFAVIASAYIAACLL
ncbi:MAG: hypothetical protein M1820_009383 [Bogoriella megaspora]|nr:MAG: hypothetical protein M1820_009383 [Bogoriella megaspora]